jgi:ferric-dicitrate binding protein FerR (iron transport regulator)
LARIESWILASPENRMHYLRLKNIWDASIDIPVSTEVAFDRVVDRIRPKNKTNIWLAWQRVAAVIMFPILLAAAWLLFDRDRDNRALASSSQTVHTAFGSYTSLELPDGSKVWLNSGSTLRYPLKFKNREREVYLQGEGYFEVHSDPESPFLVETQHFTVRATGTSFNVSSYEDEPNSTVTLVEGKVAVQTPATDNDDTQLLATLHPQDHFDFDNNSHKNEVSREETYKYIAWKEGKLVFRNDLFSEVARRISLQYNVEVVISDPEIRNNRYWATFRNEPLTELLRLLKLTAPISYNEIDPVVLPDGSFSKRKIIIYSTDINKPGPKQ